MNFQVLDLLVKNTSPYQRGKKLGVLVSEHGGDQGGGVVIALEIFPYAPATRHATSVVEVA